MKGFFSFLILILIISILLNFIVIINDSNFNKKTTITELIAIENASKERVILENSVDKIIKNKLIEITITQKTDLSLSKELINLALFNYLKNKVYTNNILLNLKSNLTFNYLTQNSQIENYKLNKVSYVRYYYTGGKNKDKLISKVFGNNLKLYFKIPIDYYQEVIG